MSKHIAARLVSMLFEPEPVSSRILPDEEVAERNRARTRIDRVPGGFEISHANCSACGEPPFGGEYCCGCKESHAKK